MCQFKENGGLGIKDTRLMNVSLLAKWIWRLLDGEETLWKDALVEKYGPCTERLLVGGTWSRHTSVWWKDLVRLNDFGVQGWFNGDISRKVGNGLKTPFWTVTWRGDRRSAHRYPRFFSISNQREAMVGEPRVISEEGSD